MPLDIGIGDGVSSVPQPIEPALALSDDGYYWYLHPLFLKLQAETRQYIDLYGDASFSGASLTSLEWMVAEAIELVRSQPQSWQVHTGTKLRPEHQELFAEVERDRFLTLLNEWRHIIERARNIGKPVVCFGD